MKKHRAAVNRSWGCDGGRVKTFQDHSVVMKQSNGRWERVDSTREQMVRTDTVVSHKWDLGRELKGLKGCDSSTGSCHLAVFLYYCAYIKKTSATTDSIAAKSVHRNEVTSL